MKQPPKQIRFPLALPLISVVNEKLSIEMKLDGHQVFTWPQANMELFEKLKGKFCMITVVFMEMDGLNLPSYNQDTNSHKD